MKEDLFISNSTLFLQDTIQAFITMALKKEIQQRGTMGI